MLRGAEAAEILEGRRTPLEVVGGGLLRCLTPPDTPPISER